MTDNNAKYQEVLRKIDREKVLISAATHMKKSTDNTMVHERVDSNIRESRKNISYLEEAMRKLQVQSSGRSQDGGPPPPAHGRMGSDHQGQYGNGPPLPPKDGRGYPMGRGEGGYQDLGMTEAGHGQMPSRAPYNDPRPYIPKARPNFSKLGMEAVKIVCVNV